MNYELAKQLKAMGFPQHDLEHIGGCWVKGNDEDACSPSLSELIKACGDYFEGLNRLNHDMTPKGWHAWSVVEDGMVLYWHQNGAMVSTKNYIRAQGCKTPEEAVARLWIALRKK